MKCQRTRLADRGEVRDRVLDVVLADDPDPGGDGLEDPVGGLALGRGDELDAGRKLFQEAVDVRGDHGGDII